MRIVILVHHNAGVLLGFLDPSWHTAPFVVRKPVQVPGKFLHVFLLAEVKEASPVHIGESFCSVKAVLIPGSC